MTKVTSSVYRLTDPTKTWTDRQWNNAWIIFPSGLTMKVFQSGPHWIDLYNPAQVPTTGTYHVGTSTYTVLSRDYGKALVLFRPKLDPKSDLGGASAVTVSLPATADNPSGVYYALTRDGKLSSTPCTSLPLRTTDGVVLIKAPYKSSPSH